jgi:hypothetical protein
MNTLIVKLNATGDVVRTTTLLRSLPGEVTWVTAPNNLPLLSGLSGNVRGVSWDDREQVRDRFFDLVVSLEDEREAAELVSSVKTQRLFGAYLDPSTGSLRYSEDARGWFDLSLISRFGRVQADRLKLQNRRTYQELVFEGLGLQFRGEPYVLPEPAMTGLVGDIAMAPVAGAVWPMKNWAYYDQLKQRLEARGLIVNALPRRSTLLEHLGDVKNHRCLVGGDSLPMHFALGLGIPCVTLFNCTSPWEIHDYGIQTKIVSPLLERFFYQRGFDPAATIAITLDEVYDAVMKKL